jgi:hypothetical protein
MFYRCDDIKRYELQRSEILRERLDVSNMTLLQSYEIFSSSSAINISSHGTSVRDGFESLVPQFPFFPS